MDQAQHTAHCTRRVNRPTQPSGRPAPITSFGQSNIWMFSFRLVCRHNISARCFRCVWPVVQLDDQLEIGTWYRFVWSDLNHRHLIPMQSTWSQTALHITTQHEQWSMLKYRNIDIYRNIVKFWTHFVILFMVILKLSIHTCCHNNKITANL